jgi:hypothetical protein
MIHLYFIKFYLLCSIFISYENSDEDPFGSIHDQLWKNPKS